jgi:hypothetical protein
MATNIHPANTSVGISRGWSNLARALADIGNGLSRGLAGLAEQRVGAVVVQPRAGLVVPPRPSDLFAQALRDNSNIAMDWLWLFSQVSSAAEQRYCLDRALAIDPHSEIARSLRAKLPW